MYMLNVEEGQGEVGVVVLEWVGGTFTAFPASSTSGFNQTIASHYRNILGMVAQKFHIFLELSR